MRRAAGFFTGVFLLASLLCGCRGGAPQDAVDVSGEAPPLSFTMTRASDGKQVTAQDFRGRVAVLYLGYTNCPDVCPLTLANLAEVLREMGSDAKRVSILFVTVDPQRDTDSVLANYVKSFAPQVVGLRGDPNQLAALARRYRLAYSVTPKTSKHPYEATHSAAVYVFDAAGAARLLIPTLASSSPDTQAIAADLKDLVRTARPPGFLLRLLSQI